MLKDSMREAAERVAKADNEKQEKENALLDARKKSIENVKKILDCFVYENLKAICDSVA